MLKVTFDTLDDGALEKVSPLTLTAAEFTALRSSKAGKSDDLQLPFSARATATIAQVSRAQ